MPIPFHEPLPHSPPAILNDSESPRIFTSLIGHLIMPPGDRQTPRSPFFSEVTNVTVLNSAPGEDFGWTIHIPAISAMPPRAATTAPDPRAITTILSEETRRRILIVHEPLFLVTIGIAIPWNGLPTNLADHSPGDGANCF